MSLAIRSFSKFSVSSLGRIAVPYISRNSTSGTSTGSWEPSIDRLIVSLGTLIFSTRASPVGVEMREPTLGRPPLISRY